MDIKSWENLEDAEILKLRMKDLKISLKDESLVTCILKVQKELGEKGLQLSPYYYLGDEWFSPEGEIAISIPFFLAHPRLRRLEKNFMMECEGDTDEEFLRLLRHEMGHVFEHAFKVSRRKKWQSIFGSNAKPYHPENYRARPYSKSFVHNIANDYAQAHPDEDFSETFAVWLNPDSNWKETYRGWGAIKKLEYIDELAREFKGIPKDGKKQKMPYEIQNLTSTLERYYKKKKKLAEVESPTFFDRDLDFIFAVTDPTDEKLESALKFLKRNRQQVVESVSFWTREKKYVIDQLYSRLVARAKELGLTRTRSDFDTLRDLMAWLASVVTHYRTSGKWARRIS